MNAHASRMIVVTCATRSNGGKIASAGWLENSANIAPTISSAHAITEPIVAIA